MKEDNSWVPDHLPKFSPREFNIEFINTKLAMDFQALVNELESTPSRLATRFVKAAAIIKMTHLSQDESSISLRSSDGLSEKDAFTELGKKITEDRKDAPIRVSETHNMGIIGITASRNERFRFEVTMNSVFGNEMAELGNIYGVEMDSALAGILAFGVDVANQERNNQSYLVIKKGDTERLLTLLEG